MNKQTLKSIGSVLAGLVAIFAISIITDIIFESAGWMKLPFHLNSTGMIIIITLYRCVYNTAGCYLAGILAPQRPMKHALILGSIGFILSIIGTIAMSGQGPLWYPIALIVTAFPCAWIGGKLAERKTNNE